MIRLTEVRVDGEAERLVLEVLRSGRLAQGPMVERFEGEFRLRAGTQYAVAVCSGTSALVAALEAIGLGPGDEVITSPFTFVATVNAILEAGATVRLVDIDPESFTISSELVEEALSPRTKAIMPVHLYGSPADLVGLERIAERADAVLVEDAAQAHGSAVNDRPVGSWGIAAFSFYATKNMTTGEGGMVTTNDEAWADRLRLLRNQGMRGRYEYEMPGHNYRMTEVQAAIGISQLACLEDWTECRRNNAEYLRDALAGVDGVIPPREPADGRHVYHQFTVRLLRDTGLDRDMVAARMKSKGIETAIYYPKLCHEYPCFSGLVIDSPNLPEAAKACSEVLSLPVHQWLSQGDLDQIATSLVEAVQESRSGVVLSAEHR